MIGSQKQSANQDLSVAARIYPFVIGGLIHDSFSTLASLNASVEGIERKLARDTAELVEKELDRLKRGSERLERVLRLIQTISQPFYKLVSHELVPTMEGIYDMVHICEEANPHVQYECEVDPAIVVGGVLPVGVATFLVGELLQNASRACEGMDNAHIALTLALSDNGKEITIECTDPGKGFSEDQLETINDGRASAPEKPGRGGYGLYLMTQIAFRLDGEISVVALEPSGSHVKLKLRPEEALNEEN